MEIKVNVNNVCIAYRLEEMDILALKVLYLWEICLQLFSNNHNLIFKVNIKFKIRKKIELELIHLDGLNKQIPKYIILDKITKIER